VAHLGEATGGRGADLPAQALDCSQVREALLDRLVAAAQRIIFRVRNGRRVPLIVGLVVLAQLGFEPGMLGLALGGGQRIDLDGAGIASHSLVLRHRRWAANRVGMPMYFLWRPG
jgi:hypothetical protein